MEMSTATHAVGVSIDALPNRAFGRISIWRIENRGTHLRLAEPTLREDRSWATPFVFDRRNPLLTIGMSTWQMCTTETPLVSTRHRLPLSERRRPSPCRSQSLRRRRPGIALESRLRTLFLNHRQRQALLRNLMLINRSLWRSIRRPPRPFPTPLVRRYRLPRAIPADRKPPG